VKGKKEEKRKEEDASREREREYGAEEKLMRNPFRGGRFGGSVGPRTNRRLGPTGRRSGGGKKGAVAN